MKQKILILHSGASFALVIGRRGRRKDEAAKAVPDSVTVDIGITVYLYERSTRCRIVEIRFAGESLKKMRRRALPKELDSLCENECRPPVQYPDEPVRAVTGGALLSRDLVDQRRFCGSLNIPYVLCLHCRSSFRRVKKANKGRTSCVWHSSRQSRRRRNNFQRCSRRTPCCGSGGCAAGYTGSCFRSRKDQLRPDI